MTHCLPPRRDRRPYHPRYIACLFLFAATAWALVPALAAEPGERGPAGITGIEAIDASAIRSRIELLLSRTDVSEAERDLALEQLRAALTRAESAASARKAAKDYAAVLQSAPEIIADLASQSANPPAAPPVAPEESVDLIRAQLRLASLQADAVASRSRQRELEDVLAAMAARPVQARAELVELRREMDGLQSAISGDASQLLVEAGRVREEAARQDLSARIERTEQELLTLPTRESIALAQRDVGVRHQREIDGVIEELQARVNRERDAEATRQVREAREAADRLADQPAAVRDYAAATVGLRALVSRLSDELDMNGKERIVLATRLEEVAEARQSTQQILAVGRIGDEYGQLLRGLQKDLPTQSVLARRAASRDDAVVEARVQQLQTQRQLRRLVDQASEEGALLVEAGLGSTPETVALAGGLVAGRRAALVDLQQIQNRQIESLVEASALDAELLQRTQQLHALLDERLLWLPSATRLDDGWARQLGQGVLWLFDMDSWLKLPTALVSMVGARPFPLVLLVAAIVALAAVRSRLGFKLERLARPIGTREDSFSTTLQCLLVTVLLALPVPLLVGGVGWALDDPRAQAPFASALGAGLLAAGIVLFMLGLFQAMCRPTGLFIAHFEWDAQGTKQLDRALGVLVLTLAPAALLTTLANVSGVSQLIEGIGRLGFIAGSLALALFLYRVFRPHGGALTGGLDPGRLAWRTRHVWFWVLVAMPLALAFLAASGYYATASELQGRLFTSGWIILASIIGFRVAMRGVLVAGRRTAYVQADARYVKARKEAQASAIPGSEVLPARPEDSEIDVVDVSEQTRALLRAAAVIVLVLLLWGIWRSMIPALGVFNDVVLWSPLAVGAGGVAVAAVTLGDLLLAMLLLGLTVIAARNLPGFLEIAVLQRFEFDSGTRYAIGAIARYLILAVGLVIVLNRIGADWSQLQWIVAALGVGLGFGLQEIVANFISGIIILFERPVRVGDLVTIGSTSGTVTRIKMRAITITDFDNFEVLVPNKAFITEPVQNWTLTSPVTRLLLKVGIAYGSGVPDAQRLMLDTVTANKNVLSLPAPSVLFLGFGESALEFEIRVFVGRIEHRLQTQHELYMALNEALAGAGIEIPFPQRDVHLKPVNDGSRA